MENYYVGAYWRDRKEGLTACRDRIIDCLEGLAKCDIAFDEVYAVPDQRLPYKISVDVETIEQIVSKGRNKEDFPPYRVIEKLGYSSTFVSKEFRKPDEKWVLNFHCGIFAEAPNILNNCVIKIPKSGKTRERLLKVDAMICLVTRLVDAWHPEWVVVQSHKFAEVICNNWGIPGKILGGWMIYFASDLGKVPDNLPIHSKLELGGQGTLLILTPDPISADRADHVSLAETVLSSLGTAGLIPV